MPTTNHGGWRIGAEVAAGGALQVISGPLTTRTGSLRGDDLDGNRYVTPTRSSVRRLTPVECERLQGLPDDWTQVAYNGRPAPDSRRYAAVGDAVTVNVAEWIGRRLREVLL